MPDEAPLPPPPPPFYICPGQVACAPKLREKWLPLVWSRQTERRLFLPHAEVRERRGPGGAGGSRGYHEPDAATRTP